MNRSFFAVTALAVTGAAASSASAVVTFFDGVFNNADWTLTQRVNTNGAGSASQGLQFLTGGNPNEYRRIRHQLVVSSPTGILHSLHINVTASYTPSSQGAITSIDYSEDSINFLNAPGNGQGTGLAILQNGRFYRQSTPSLVMPFSTYANWNSNTALGLTAASFWEVDINGNVLANVPDFTATGSIMQLGFYRGNSNNGSINTDCGIDNWNVHINNVPTPGAAAVLGLGGLSVLRRRRR